MSCDVFCALNHKWNAFKDLNRKLCFPMYKCRDNCCCGHVPRYNKEEEYAKSVPVIFCINIFLWYLCNWGVDYPLTIKLSKHNCRIMLFHLNANCVALWVSDDIYVKERLKENCRSNRWNKTNYIIINYSNDNKIHQFRIITYNDTSYKGVKNKIIWKTTINFLYYCLEPFVSQIMH